ncbi:MAG TPA: ROK family protein [Acidimicrobiia bacterium]|nr:ROK family protein [Acidimicrobiia bacterium]
MTDTQPIARSGLTPLSTMAKATRGQTRLNNLRLALQLVYTSFPTSRADVARASHLTPATASDLVDELLDLGLVVEVGTGPSAGGKPPTLIAPNPEGRSIIALDLSSTDFLGAVVDLSGEVVSTETVPGAVGDQALQAARDLVARLAAASTSPLLGVGVGTPGVVDPAHGSVTSANLGWQEAALGAAIAEKTVAPVHIINDAQAAVLHEYSVHTPRVNSLALVRVGRGIGTGYVLDGHLYRGDNAATGEIGHVRLDDSDRPCTCGNQGCLETFASISALLEAVGGDQEPTHDRVAEIASDPSADEAVREAAVALGRGLASMVALLAVREIVLWGEVTSLSEPYRATVEEEIRSRVLRVNTDQIRVRFASAGPDAVIRGAAGLVLSTELGVVW